jgi:endoglucanase
MTRRRRGARPLAAVAAALALLAGCTSGADGQPAPPPATGGPAPALRGPLHTDGRWVVDRAGQRVKLVGVNWSGAETPSSVVGGLDVRPLDELAGRIAAAGFDVVRLPVSNELVETDPVVADRELTANPELRGRHALEVLDAVVAALGRHGVMVVLDDHRSRADWCCDTAHGDGLWYTPQHPEQAWLADWRTLARRYRDVPAVVGADLRNEIRPEPQLAPGPTRATWGDGDPRTDWAAAAQRAGDAVLAEAPDWLVVVEGLDYAANLTPAYTHPVSLSRPGRLVWAAHDYRWMHTAGELSSYPLFGTILGVRFGGLTVAGRASTAPVWLDETGTCTQPAPGSTCSPDDAAYLRQLTRYLTTSDLDVAFWQLDGTQGSGYGRTPGAVETYGLLRRDWTTWADPDLMTTIRRLARPTSGPGVR